MGRACSGIRPDLGRAGRVGAAAASSASLRHQWPDSLFALALPTEYTRSFAKSHGVNQTRIGRRNAEGRLQNPSNMT